MKFEIQKAEKEVQNSREELNSLLSNSRLLELPVRTIRLIENLNNEDRLYFLAFCNNQIYQEIKTEVANDTEKIRKFINLGLITPPHPITQVHELTQIGTIVYAYLDKDINQNVPF